jgi:hypothetical protein
MKSFLPAGEADRGSGGGRSPVGVEQSAACDLRELAVAMHSGLRPAGARRGLLGVGGDCGLHPGVRHWGAAVPVRRG